jgi:hypothetical protein
MELEAFEKARPPRRSQMDLVLTRGERHRLLVEWGASGQDVIESIRMIIRVKNQRRQTVNNLGSYDRIEEMFEKLSRRMRRLICQSSSNTAALKLKQESERVASMDRGKQTLKKSSPSGTTSVEAPSETETTTPISSPQIRKGQISTKAGGRESKPPCTEVRVMKTESLCSINSDAEDLAPSFEMTSNTVSGTKKHVEAKEEEHDDAYQHETDNDLDNVSNPQSHDYRERISIAPVPIRAVVESIDV